MYVGVRLFTSQSNIKIYKYTYIKCRVTKTRINTYFAVYRCTLRNWQGRLTRCPFHIMCKYLHNTSQKVSAKTTVSLTNDEA